MAKEIALSIPKIFKNILEEKADKEQIKKLFH